ncbi:MAG: hypothetical protein Q4F79_12505 [Eubacteriales bacterium]|nr:hypothetical protein [Eubacteriales bacterium]
MKLKDLEKIIAADSDVGLIDKTESGIPIVDTWGHWINGGLKTLDVPVLKIVSYGYILLVLDV